MPRLVAYKHPVWTGRIVRSHNGTPGQPYYDVKILGVYLGNTVVGREINGDRHVWTFYGGDGTPGLPPWCEVISEWTGEDADAWRAAFVMTES